MVAAVPNGERTRDGNACHAVSAVAAAVRGHRSEAKQRKGNQSEDVTGRVRRGVGTRRSVIVIVYAVSYRRYICYLLRLNFGDGLGKSGARRTCRQIALKVLAKGGQELTSIQRLSD